MEGERGRMVNAALVAALLLVLGAGLLLLGLSWRGVSVEALLQEPWAVRARSVLVIVFASLLAYWGVLVVTAKVMAGARPREGEPPSEREMRAATLASIVRNTGVILILLMAGLLILAQFIQNLGPLVAGAGVLGVALGFGAQSLVKDVIAGFFVMLENQFHQGDVIRAAGGIAGVVERMTLRATYLRDLHGTLHIIPNGELGVVSNLTAEWSQAVCAVEVSYGSNLDRAVEVLARVCEELRQDPQHGPRILGPAAVQGVIELGESGIVLRALIRTAPGGHWEVEREFYRRIKAAFDQEGIDFAYPTRTIHLATPAEHRIAEPSAQSEATSESSASNGE